MNYDEVVSGVRQRYGNTPPPADPEQERRILQNRALFPEAVRSVEMMRRKNEEAPESRQVCLICGGTAWADVGELIDGYHFVTACKCHEVQVSRQRMKESGLSRIMQEYTFDSFQTVKPFQKAIAQMCASYVQAVLTGDPFKPMPWLFLGGQSGCGKTHICTAVVNKLLSENVPCTYVSWNEESRKLKAASNDPEYPEVIRPLLEAKVLYIDDLFKGKAKTPPTEADVKIAWEILNRRDVQGLATIVSSEWTLDELVGLDASLGGHIKARCGSRFAGSIDQDSTKNFRLNAG